MAIMQTKEQPYLKTGSNRLASYFNFSAILLFASILVQKYGSLESYKGKISLGQLCVVYIYVLLSFLNMLLGVLRGRIGTSVKSAVRVYEAPKSRRKSEAIMIKPAFSASFVKEERELKKSNTVIELNDESYRKALGIPTSART